MNQWMWLAALPVLALAGSPAGTEELRTTWALPVREAFENGLGAWNVRLAGDGQGLILYDHVLIEDDGPGISSDVKWLKTDRAPTTAVGGAVRIKKVLRVERPQSLAARLYVASGVKIEVNGQAVDAPGTSEFPPLPPALLKPGDNEIVLSAPGEAVARIKMAKPEDIFRNAPERRGTPRRSFVSTDGGRTWQPAEGEHMVRLHLVQYAREGRMISPAIDLGRRQDDTSPLLVPVTVTAVKLKANAATPGRTAVKLAVRTGPCPVYDERLWSAWKPAEAVRVPAGHRYLQWRATLTSADPVATPVLKGVSVEATVAAEPPPAWAARIKVAGYRNADIRYTSIPFAYEDPDSPKMAALRKKYKLDEVVAGAKTELEKMVKLRNWVARQWPFTPPAENYPAWDADEILTRKYGFCVQYAITFMQCATALGHQARFVFGDHPGAVDGGGHEVCEWWSNEYGKWVFFDCNQNWFYLNPKTGVPYNLLEIHDAIIQEYYGGGFAEWAKRPRAPRYSPEFAMCYGDSVVPNTPPGKGQAWHIKDGLYRVPSRWLNLRYMPRNNFLGQPRPVPMLQGCHWDWSDYIIHEDAQTPKEWLYRHFTSRQSDIAWTINQVRFDAAWGTAPGTVAIQMGTSTPYLETFLVKADNGQWTRSGRTWSWKLKPGANRLEMRVRNTSGIDGPVSRLEVEYRVPDGNTP